MPTAESRTSGTSRRTSNGCTKISITTVPTRSTPLRGRAAARGRGAARITWVSARCTGKFCGSARRQTGSIARLSLRPAASRRRRAAITAPGLLGNAPPNAAFPKSERGVRSYRQQRRRNASGQRLFRILTRKTVEDLGAQAAGSDIAAERSDRDQCDGCDAQAAQKDRHRERNLDAK